MTPQLLEFGYVSRAHGLKGELEIRPFDSNTEVFEHVERLTLRRRNSQADEPFVLRHVRGSKDGYIVQLESITQREAAEALVGSRAFVDRSELPPLEEGEYFQGDFIGLRALTSQGTEIGEVKEIWNTGPVPNLVIRSSQGQEWIVPYVDEFVVKVDLPARTLTVVLPEFTEPV